MIGFLVIFFTVTVFDWIEIFKEKRKNEILIYTILSVIAIGIAIFEFQIRYKSSVAESILNILNIKE